MYPVSTESRIAASWRPAAVLSSEIGQMFAVETRRISAAEIGQMSAVKTRQMLKCQIWGLALNHQNGPKWFQNGRQVMRIGHCESPGHFLASRTGPAGPNRKNIAQTLDQPPPTNGRYWYICR